MYQEYQYLENSNTWIWVGQVSTAAASNQKIYTWYKPKYCQQILIYALGAGGSGGGGGASTVTTAGGGGGGGGAGASTCLIINANLIPSPLFILPGSARVGGNGQIQGGAPNSGSNGQNTRLTYTTPFSGNNNLIIADPGSGGTGGSGNTAGGGGSGGIFRNSNTGLPVAGLGFYASTAGMNGVAGGSAAVGTDITPFGGFSLATGGAGGGGVDAGINTFAGGNILTHTFAPQINGGIAGGGAGIQGYNWHEIFQRLDLPAFSSGGSGGGGNTLVGTGGIGGDAGIGSGGAGGGGTNGVASVGGKGGSGGPGMVLILCV